MFLGLLNRIRSPEFLVDFGVMYDALYELSSLSELLQNRSRAYFVGASRQVHAADNPGFTVYEEEQWYAFT